MKKTPLIKGRGAQINTPNPFHTQQLDTVGTHWHDQDEEDEIKRTTYISTHPKTFINKVKSPDLNFPYSANPYQGCEHGCIYCYARNTHTYWGYSAGIEFEQKILVKHNAPKLLEQKIKSKNWEPQPIMFSGNTDCYQPAEKTYQLTRQCLEILWRYRHPLSMITKSSLILRDLDILAQLAEHQLVRVAISITTLAEDLRLKLEPRTASGQKRLQVIKALSDVGVPVHVMIAPLIPSLNDHEIDTIAKLSAEAGAQSMSYTMVRLNGDVGTIFKDWLEKEYPDRYARVLKQIESMHDGELSDSRFGKRMKGEGHVAQIISQQVKLARKKYFSDRSIPEYNTELYHQMKNPQMKLF